MAADETLLRGACLCGSIRFTIVSGRQQPVATYICYCSGCQRSTCSASGYCMFIKDMKEHFHIDAGESHIKIFEDNDNPSGKLVRRYFCSNCGSGIISTTHGLPAAEGGVTVNMGCLEEEARKAHPPQFECFGKHRHDWIDTLAKLPRFEGLPGASKVTTNVPA